MSDDKQREVATRSGERATPEEAKRGVDWSNPDIAVGNSPPMPRWPLAFLGVAWVGWLAFLVAMLIETRGTTGL